MIFLKNLLSEKQYKVTIKSIIGGDVYIFENKTYMTMYSLGVAMAKKANRLTGNCVIGFTESSDEKLASEINSVFSLHTKHEV